jgi:hypothetical protein
VMPLHRSWLRWVSAGAKRNLVETLVCLLAATWANVLQIQAYAEREPSLSERLNNALKAQ